ncbi:MAG: hypothetical protein KC729_05165, partial [Candidatus Eisenbacteria bacterium]|nr:hypothetical protein [Candidatus Eisenbacteria bacterium]
HHRLGRRRLEIAVALVLVGHRRDRLPGGRLAISDMVAIADLSDQLRRDMVALTGCIAGAESIPVVEAMLRDAGFVDIQIRTKAESREIIGKWTEVGDVADLVASATIEARKPR